MRRGGASRPVADRDQPIIADPTTIAPKIADPRRLFVPRARTNSRSLRDTAPNL